MSTKEVIDLSQFNTIDNFDGVKSSIDAVIPRLGYRGATTGTITYDPKYNEYVSACEKKNIPMMFYFFPCSITDSEAESEAKFIISAAKKVKLCGPIWLDSELVYQKNKSGRSDRLSKADRTRFLNVILKRLHEEGYDCGVYASKSWFDGNLNDKDLVPYCLRWVAQWSDKCTYSRYPVNMWQYTNNGSVNGIRGRVDMSKCYVELNSETNEKPLAPKATRMDVVNQICSWEGWSERNGKFKIIINIYNYYLKTAVKSGTVNYKVQYDDEWCATAASAAYIQAGIPELFPIECGCPRNISLAKKMGIWIEADNYVPKIADAVLYDWQDSGNGDNTGTPDHIGIVISVDEKAGTFVVMEGNKNESVERRTMKINGKYIRGFISPKFDDSSNNTSVKAPKKSIDDVAKEVINGWWGNNEERVRRLTEAGYDAVVVQNRVNGILNGNAVKPQNGLESTKKTTATKSVTASAYAKNFDSKLGGTYKTTANLYMRHDAGKNKKAMVIIPKGAEVKCYGYYSVASNKTKWLYIRVIIDGISYTGFSSILYLEKE